MTSRVLSNQKGGKIVVLFTANTVMTVASANVDATETVTGLHINQAWYGLDDGGYWKISRGSNTIQIAGTSTFLDYAGCGAAIQIDPAANVVVNCTSANSTLIIDFQKVSTYTSQY
jgi:hypothetical protein